MQAKCRIRVRNTWRSRLVSMYDGFLSLPRKLRCRTSTGSTESYSRPLSRCIVNDAYAGCLPVMVDDLVLEYRFVQFDLRNLVAAHLLPEFRQPLLDHRSSAQKAQISCMLPASPSSIAAQRSSARRAASQSSVGEVMCTQRVVSAFHCSLPTPMHLRRGQIAPTERIGCEHLCERTGTSTPNLSHTPTGNRHLTYDGFQSPAAGPASGRVSPESHDAIVTIRAWS